MPADVIFQLHHAYEDEYGRINRKSLGIHSTREAAARAQAHYATLPGFCDYPDDFVVVTIAVDVTAWTEGFIPATSRDDEGKATRAAARMAARAMPPLKHHERPAPDGYWIHERRRGETSLGCEVGRINGSVIGHDLVEAAAYHRALEHASGRLGPCEQDRGSRGVPQSFFSVGSAAGESVDYFKVYHDYETPDGDDELKTIGIYRTQEAAERALAHAETLPGFRDYPDDLFMGLSTLDDCSAWLDGFVTIVCELQYGDERKAAADAGARAFMPVTRRERPAPDGYWIDELWCDETLLGYSVGRMDEPAFAEGLIETVAYQRAIDDATAMKENAS